ncbi:MAG: TIGR00730 family Rossman fold protein [Candidatus Melainabacteria bacterium]|nr:TIGR00730 family Rossman fold protein [Candidatus Melainabacteria bacterium]
MVEERPDKAYTDKADQNLRSQVLYSRLFGAGSGDSGATTESGATNAALSDEALFQVLGKRTHSKAEEPAPQPMLKAQTVNAEAPASEQGAPPQSALAHGAEVFRYNLIQAPLTGLTQLADNTLGTRWESQTRFYQAPTPAAYGSAAWVAEVAGGVAAGAVPFLLLHKAIGPGAVAKVEVMGNYSAAKTLPVIGKSALVGAGWGGVLTPVQEGENFWPTRLNNSLSNAAAFATLTAGTVALKRSGSTFLRNDMVAGTASGAVGGFVAADSRSLLSTGQLASGTERLHSMSTFALGGLMLGGATTAYQNFRPASGIAGVRTPEDMRALADRTIRPGHPERYAFEPEQKIPAKADALMAESKVHSEWHNRASVAVRQEIDSSNMPVDAKKLVVSGFQEMSYGLEALHSRPQQKPIMVVYGSARFKENDFRYQRARYIGGRAVEEGFDVMTGGGPGTMEGANRGAYEAGGNSIGVVLKLPHEKRGNGYQTMTLKHRNFFTRMEMLKQGDVFIVEDGGIGTAAEALDTLTHIQTGKLKEVPIYFVGKDNYKKMDSWLAQMERNGTISPNDRHLYRIVDNPDDIFLDLERRRSQSGT